MPMPHGQSPYATPVAAPRARPAGRGRAAAPARSRREPTRAAAPHRLPRDCARAGVAAAALLADAARHRALRRALGAASRKSGRIPGPAQTWDAAVTIFADPFYRKGPNDQGIGWNVLSSLERVGIGFGLAALVGIPLGFMIGRFKLPLRHGGADHQPAAPVSPLAWLPIGLLVFKAANPAAIYVIFICSIWPMIINTAVGVQRSPAGLPERRARAQPVRMEGVHHASCSRRCCPTC